MELLHTYNDGSYLYKMSARSLSKIPTWKGNRNIILEHIHNIKQAIGNNITLLDSGYKIIQYSETDNTGTIIKSSYIIDGQHRKTILAEYFESNKNATDFIVTVTELHVDSEDDAIEYFNKINNVKPIQYEEDTNMIINKYLSKLIKAFPEKKKLIRNTSTKRPYLSTDKFREVLTKYVQQLKYINTDEFVKRCVAANSKIVEELTANPINGKEAKIAERVVQLDFGLAFDDRFNWLTEILK